MTASLHKLSAGDGYTYLTRQVAAADSTELGGQSLADYYSAKGESPGRWRGAGLASLGRVGAGEVVTEEHMRALFGEGRHPCADEIQREVITAATKDGSTEKQAARQGQEATKLGAAFGAYDDKPSEFIVRVTRAYREANKARGASRDAALPDAERAAIRTRVGRETFVEEFEREPVDERELAAHIARSSRPPRRPVAGYDVTFSPVKSVSTLWAVAPRPVAEQVEEAHQAAVEDAMDWIERTVSYTRRGRAGVRQVDINGLLMAQFTHRDSRAGDPDLHTHVAISNKVQALDGTWLALDGQPLHQALVSASERYNTRLEAELVERLGVSFVERDEPVRSGKRAVREIDGVDADLMARWSQRRAAIDVRRAELARDFLAEHGRPPTPKEAIALAQQATLDTREAKHEPRSLAEQRQQWREQAEEVFAAKGRPDGLETMLATVRSTLSEDRRGLSEDERDDLAAAAVRAVEASRAQWSMVHVRAEVERRIRAAGVPLAVLDEHVEDCVDRALAPQRSVRLGPASTHEAPVELRRRDGQSQYERAHSALYSSERVMASEAAIVAAATQRDSWRITEEQVGVALLEAAANGTELDDGQTSLVSELATSGARLQLALAPAGAGKTTAMRALSRAWEGAGGRVIGLAPSAAASTELGSSIGSDADTLAKLVWHLEHPDVPAPDWMHGVDERTLVLIDEAGMASTPDLAAAVEFVTSRGGSVRLVGDDQQLGAVGAGGVLRDIATEVGAAELTQLHRFTAAAEADATLGLRAGRAEALGFYLDAGRVHVGADEASTIEQVFDAWTADTEQGRTALMLAATNETVTALNARARDHRLRGTTETGPSVRLASGLHASAGDRIITRTNDRRLRITGTHWVKNGDRLTVESVALDGSVTARHDGTGRSLTLPAEYVRDRVDLGYASTFHGAQGSTVDVTHCAVTGQETRQLLYVGMSRGRSANHVYVPVSGDGDPHASIRPEVLSPRTAVDVLEQIIRRDGAARSARTEARDLLDPALRLRAATQQYADAVDAAAYHAMGPDRITDLTGRALALRPDLADCDAWEALLAHLCRIEADGDDAIAALDTAIRSGSLTGARDAAAVLDWRLDPGRAHSTGTGPLPWLPSALEATDPSWVALQRSLAEEISDLARQVRAAALESPAAAWAEDLPEDLRGDLAVWRAALGVPDDERSLTGPPRLAAAEKSVQAALDRRAHDHRDHAPHPGWKRLVTVPRVTRDPYWKVLSARLDGLATQGVDVEQLITEALGAGPLPDDHAAAALDSRLTAALDGPESVSPRLRPTWAPALVTALGPAHAVTVMSDRAWLDLVGTLEGCAHDGHDPAAVVRSAASMLDLAAVDTAYGVPSGALATVLLGKVREVIEVDVTPEDPTARPSETPEPPPDISAPPPDTSEPPQPHLAEPPRATDPAADETVPATAGTGRDRLLALTAAAARFYEDALEGSSAQTYLRGRTGPADLTRYTIGYAPAEWSSLVEHLQAQHGATDDELVDAGLAKWSRRGTLYDVFRDRLVFGLHDARGDLVGFVGRAAPGRQGDGPKYLNTPETAIFHKRAVLFGLHESQDELHAGAVPVRVEGTFDAIAVTAAGDGRAVGLAPLGTALSDVQADTLAQVAGETGVVAVAPDPDAAGRAAAARDYWTLVQRRITPLVLPVPSGDPATAWEKSPEMLGTLCALAAESPPLASLVIEERLAPFDRDLGHGWVQTRIDAARAVAPVIASAPVTSWAQHVRETAEHLGDCDSEAMIWSQVMGAAIAWNPLVEDRADTSARTVADARAELLELAAELGLDRDEGPDHPRDALALLTEALDEHERRLREPAARDLDGRGVRGPRRDEPRRGPEGPTAGGPRR